MNKITISSSNTPLLAVRDRQVLRRECLNSTPVAEVICQIMADTGARATAHMATWVLRLLRRPTILIIKAREATLREDLKVEEDLPCLPATDKIHTVKVGQGP